MASKVVLAKDKPYSHGSTAASGSYRTFVRNIRKHSIVRRFGVGTCGAAEAERGIDAATEPEKIECRREDLD